VENKTQTDDVTVNIQVCKTSTAIQQVLTFYVFLNLNETNNFNIYS
jgi:hypothetical protein